MIIKINKALCIGCGSCMAVCPANFEMGDDGKAKVINSAGSECDQEAIDICPVQAIEKE